MENRGMMPMEMPAIAANFRVGDDFATPVTDGCGVAIETAASFEDNRIIVLEGVVADGVEIRTAVETFVLA